MGTKMETLIIDLENFFFLKNLKRQRKKRGNLVLILNDLLYLKPTYK